MVAKKTYYSWYDFEDAVTEIERQISFWDKIDFVVGIPRGGVILAIVLSHRTGTKHMTIDHFEKVKNSLDPKRILIVDDISDSGQTLKSYVDEGYITATWHERFSTVAKPDFRVELLENTDWVVYPWEAKDSKTIQDYLDA